MRKFNLLAFLSLLLVVFAFLENVDAQAIVKCNIDGDEFEGTVKDAHLVSFGAEQFIQIQVAKGDKILYLQLKHSKLTEPLPINLDYRAHNYDTGETPDAEMIWAPDGPEDPQWNTIEGKALVTSYDPETKTLAGSFEFVVEKQVYSSRKDKPSPKAEVENGMFTNIVYSIPEKK